MTSSGQEYRLNTRVAARVPAVVFGTTGGLREIPMTTRNLSLGGALCTSVAAVPPGATVKLRLDLEDEAGVNRPVVLEAIILRVEGRGPYEVAFHFTSVPAATAAILKDYLQRLIRASVP